MFQLALFEEAAPPAIMGQPEPKPIRKIKLEPRAPKPNPVADPEPKPEPKNVCQWIEGEPRRALKCGAAVIKPRCAWCEEHYRIVYRPTPPIKL